MPISNIQIKQVTDQKLIKKWMVKFLKSYHGNLNCLGDKELMENVLDPAASQFIFAYSNNKPVGFVRVAKYSALGDPETSCIQEGFVRGPNRSKGILRMLIQESVARYDVGYVLLSTDRVNTLRFYYTSLGFKHQIPHPESVNLRYLATQGFIDRNINQLMFAA